MRSSKCAGQKAMWSVAVLVLLAVLGGAVPARAQAREAEARVEVERLTFAVMAGGRAHKVVGYLYHDGSLDGRPLQVAVHGGTYDHRYWDLPDAGGEAYSYARYMVRQGYAVLALDQLGVGESGRPADGDTLTVDVAGAAVDQVVRALRTGDNPLRARFGQVALVGHSLGSNVAIWAQGALQTPVDALVSTGLGHVGHWLPLPDTLPERIEVNDYWWMTPEERTAAFFHAPQVDPALLAYDNAQFTHPISRGIFTTAMVETFNPERTRVGDVSVPVLVQFGDQDLLFGSAFADGEEAFWTSAPSVTVQHLTDMGHCYNVHRTRYASWRGIDAWLRSALGPGAASR